MLPNFAYSIPLAYFFLSLNQGSCVAHKPLKLRLTKAQSQCYKDKKDLRTQADAMLLQALIAFPEFFLKVMQENGLEIQKDLATSAHFTAPR
jgi:hypothetical protein